MSDPETGSGIPDLEKFSSREEERKFTRAQFDPNVKRAMDAMEQHADELEGEPASPIERLLEEFMAERAKSTPDPTKLEDIRNRMKQEQVLVAAQTVTPEKEARHKRDMVESESLNEREDVVNKINQTRSIIEGLEKDIHEMAVEVSADITEEYPAPFAAIIDDMTMIRENVFDDIGKALGDPKSGGSTPRSLINERKLLSMDGQVLMKTYGLLLQARDKMIDQQSEMLKAVTEWRQNHQAS